MILLDAFTSLCVVCFEFFLRGRKNRQRADSLVAIFLALRARRDLFSPRASPCDEKPKSQADHTVFSLENLEPMMMMFRAVLFLQSFLMVSPMPTHKIPPGLKALVSLVNFLASFKVAFRHPTRNVNVYFSLRQVCENSTHSSRISLVRSSIN